VNNEEAEAYASQNSSQPCSLSLVSHLSLFMTDLRNDRYAASVGAKHYLTSAKLNKGLDELFLDLSRRTLHAPILFFFFFPSFRCSFRATPL
jgi:hypothetical protein